MHLNSECRACSESTAGFCPEHAPGFRIVTPRERIEGEPGPRTVQRVLGGVTPQFDLFAPSRGDLAARVLVALCQQPLAAGESLTSARGLSRFAVEIADALLDELERPRLRPAATPERDPGAKGAGR